MAIATERQATVSVTVGGQDITFETGKLAKQAVGAVRIGLIEGELTVNPTLAAVEDLRELDLIVVGTPEGLTMVEAGANEVPEDRLLEALDLAHAEIKNICEAQLDLQRQAGKAKWLDDSVTEDIERDHGAAIRDRINAEGLRAADAVVEELLPPLSMDSTEEDVQQLTQQKLSLATVLERVRFEAVLG